MMKNKQFAVNLFCVTGVFVIHFDFLFTWLKVDLLKMTSLLGASSL